MRTVTPSCRTSTARRWSSTPGNSLIASTSRALAANDPVRKNAVPPSPPSTRQSLTPSASWNCFGLIRSVMALSLRLDHVGAGDLVVPALLLCIECRPDHADEEHHQRDDEPDEAKERAAVVQVRTVGLHHADVECTTSERL